MWVQYKILWFNILQRKPNKLSKISQMLKPKISATKKRKLHIQIIIEKVHFLFLDFQQYQKSVIYETVILDFVSLSLL